MPSSIAFNIASVIVNFNGWADTLLCLHSLLNAHTIPGTILVIDNGSTDDSFQQISRWAKGEYSPPIPNGTPISSRVSLAPPEIDYDFFTSPSPDQLPALTKSKPRIVLIRTNRNRGYAAGVNLGLQHALKIDEIQWIWILNNDVVVSPSALQALTSCASQNPDIGLWGGKLMEFDHPEIIQAVGGKYNPCFAMVSHIGQGEIDHGQYNQFLIPDYIVGASMYVSRAFIESVGFLNEDYFLYFEELDWTVRGRRKGWVIGYCWKCVVYHREGQTTGGKLPAQKSELADFYLVRNRLRFTRAFYPWCLPTVYLSFLGVIFRRILRGQWNRIPKIIKILITHEI